MTNALAPILSIYEGDPVYQPLLDDFVAKLPSRLIEVCNTLKTGDIAAIKRELHRFKGSSATYGFPQVANLVKNMEEQVVNEGPGKQDFLMKLEKSFNHIVTVCASVTTFGGSSTKNKEFMPNAEILKIQVGQC